MYVALRTEDSTDWRPVGADAELSPGRLDLLPDQRPVDPHGAGGPPVLGLEMVNGAGPVADGNPGS
jgi:hypothetical protein